MPIVISTTSLKRKRRRRTSAAAAAAAGEDELMRKKMQKRTTATLLLRACLLVLAASALAASPTIIGATHHNCSTATTCSRLANASALIEATTTTKATKQSQSSVSNNNNGSRVVLSADSQQQHQHQQESKEVHNKKEAEEEFPKPQALSWTSAATPSSSSRSRGLGQTTAASQRESGEIGEGLTLGGESDRQQQQQQQLTLQQLERIKGEASKVSALLGQNVILNCAVEFKDGIEKPFVVNWLKYPLKLPIYIWYAGYPPHVHQGYEDRASRIGQASLNLSKVRPSDQGLYECKIYYLDKRPQETQGQGTWIYLDVQAPPHFTQVPAPLNYVQAGDSLRLTCQAESEPSPILRWYKNMTPIDSDEGPYRVSASEHEPARSGAEDASPVGGGSSSGQARRIDLFIDNVQAGSTTGNYTCLASNSEGSVEARSQVVLAVPAVIITLPRNQTRLEGEKLELFCQARALPSNITYKWFFNQKPIQLLKWFESRYLIQPQGTLVINSLYRDDQGEYKCQATNGLSHRAVVSGSTSPAKHQKAVADQKAAAPIYAEASAYVTVEFPARITYSPQVQYLPLGLSGQIRCFVQAAPPVEFWTWTKNNSQFDPNLDPNIERLTNGSLLIKQVTRDYEGTYRCTPFNKHGSAGSSAAMELRVQEPPYFELKPLDFYKATLNDQVKIACSGRGIPKPSLSWRKVMPGPDDSHANQRQQQSVISSSTTVLPAPVLLADEAADESSSLARAALDADATSKLPTNGQLSDLSNSNSNSNINEQEQQQQSLISYAKLPSDRSEYKNGHLLLYHLKKEDHGRYECVIENEVATLIRSTMLYIEETTPHAPTNVRVDTKAWSAQVTWKPGYDGGFEQSFVVLYRQVPSQEHASSNQNYASSSSETIINQATAMTSNESIDFNWKSISVAPAADSAASLTVHNLSQDTSYEFYVKAKNIIGEGPRSQIALATTKRALQGSLAPVEDPLSDPLASTYPYDASTMIPSNVNHGDEEEPDVTINPSVMGIIHLVDVTPTPSGDDDANDQTSSASQSNSVQSSDLSSSGGGGVADQLQQQQQPASDNSSKVIRIYRPTKQSSLPEPPSKRPRFDQPEPQASGSNSSDSSSPFSSTTQATFVDLSTAPQNVSMIKVAQGWVINWWPPKRLPTEPSISERLAGSANHLLPALSQQLLEAAAAADSQQPTASSQSGPTNQLQPAAYSIEFREKGKGWEQLATTRERSHLIKDKLKPGGEYIFRVYAHSSHGAKGSPSADFSYLIPDNRRKPGSAQAMSAGVVSGMLFFVACIAMAVCAVNCCNKRRKKRAEKAAYVMMACPVLESHHDIAALNSNSLAKNSISSAPEESGISGVRGRQLRRNLHESLFRDSNDIKPIRRLAGSICQLGRQIEATFSRLLAQISSSASDNSPTRSSSAQQQQPSEIQSVRYTSNAPVAVDVDVDIRLEEKRQPKEEKISSSSGGGSLDDYWICRPSDRKWGTLTVAGSKLAERRALERQLKQQQQQQQQQQQAMVGANEQQERDSITGELFYSAIEGDLCNGLFKINNDNSSRPGSRTLPRSFRTSPIKQQIERRFVRGATTAGNNSSNSNNNEVINESQQQQPAELQNQSHRQQQQFTDWLNEQLAARRRAGQSDYDGSSDAAGAVAGASTARVVDNGDDGDRRRQRQRLVCANDDLPPSNGPASQHQRSMSQIEPPPSSLPNGQLHQHQHQLQLQPHSYTAAALLSYYQWQNYYYLQRATHQQSHHLGAPASALMSFANCQPLRQQQQQQHQQLQKRSMMVGRPLDVGDAIATPALHHQFEQQQQSSWLFAAKRNSPARRTLPMAHQQRGNFYAPDQSAASNSICPFYPSVTFEASTEPSNNDHHDRGRNCSGGGGCEGCNEPRAAAANNSANPLQDRNLDDPLTANACLGSNKRKRRLPHIEAKFSIESESAGAGSGDHIAQRHQQEDGHLFVRSINLQQQQHPPPPQTQQRVEPGYPRPGQRSEQRRWRPPPQLAHVQTIGAREKIESYLRHYDQVQAGDNCVFESSETEQQLVEIDKVEELTFQPYYNLPSLKYTIKLPIHRGEDGTLLLNETSQLRRSQRGSRTRQSSGAADGSTSIGTEMTTATPAREQPRAAEAGRTRPLGSSSSCPAPPIGDDNDQSLRVLTLEGGPSCSLSLEGGLSQPTMGHPLLPVRSLKGVAPMGSNQIPKDSLEKSIDSVAHSVSVRAQKVNCSAAVANNGSADAHQEIEPFYLHQSDNSGSVTNNNNNNNNYNIAPGSSATGSSRRDDVIGQRRSENSEAPAPPIPPHRSESSKSIGDGAGAKAADQPTRKPLEVSSSSSPSPASSSSSTSSSSSSSSSSGATTTADGHDAGAVSESLTNDHSVDENYEFDAVSSSSSSQINRQRARAVHASLPLKHQSQTNNETSPARQLLGQHLYTQVNKKARPPRAGAVERSRLYDFSRQRELPLGDCKPTSDHCYDTVQEPTCTTDNTSSNLTGQD